MSFFFYFTDARTDFVFFSARVITYCMPVSILLWDDAVFHVDVITDIRYRHALFSNRFYFIFSHARYNLDNILFRTTISAILCK